MVLERISSKLYEWEDEKARKQEEELRAGGDPPMKLANRISDDVLRLTLPKKKKETSRGNDEGRGPPDE